MISDLKVERVIGAEDVNEPDAESSKEEPPEPPKPEASLERQRLPLLPNCAGDNDSLGPIRIHGRSFGRVFYWNKGIGNISSPSGFNRHLFLYQLKTGNSYFPSFT